MNGRVPTLCVKHPLSVKKNNTSDYRGNCCSNSYMHYRISNACWHTTHWRFRSPLTFLYIAHSKMSLKFNICVPSKFGTTASNCMKLCHIMWHDTAVTVNIGTHFTSTLCSCYHLFNFFHTYQRLHIIINPLHHAKTSNSAQHTQCWRQWHGYYQVPVTELADQHLIHQCRQACTTCSQLTTLSANTWHINCTTMQISAIKFLQYAKKCLPKWPTWYAAVKQRLKSAQPFASISATDVVPIYWLWKSQHP